MTFRSRVLLFCLALLPASLIAADDQHQARMVVHLLDYLAKDYAGAVSDTGVVLSESEYAEQVEFAKTAVKASTEIPELTSQPAIGQGVASLLAEIEGKSPPAKIIPLARAMQTAVLAATKLQVTPVRWPNLTRAAKLFADNCALCHGTTGGGDGPAGVALDPKPANFLDHEMMDAAAPLGEFNTIRLGVPGTGMTPFPQLSDEDTWSLAAYVISLRHMAPTSDLGLKFDNELLIKASTLNDINLAQHLGVSLEDKGGKLAAVRLHSENTDKVNTLSLAKTYLTEAENAYAAGDFKHAKNLSLKSYLEGIEPVEPRLRAESSEIIISLETTMSAVRNVIENRGTQADLKKAIAEAVVVINDADSRLSKSGVDARLAFVAASGILLREGFEAALLILSLLSVIRVMGAKRAAYWVHGGWIAAVILGVVCWFLLGVVFDISGATRELMEGVTSLIAVLVLVSVGFWLHRHAEIGRWTKFLKEKVKHAVDTKNLIGLASISFLAVFREALETVLFLRVIWFDADASAKTSMLSGIGLTLILIFGASWAAIRYSAKIPVTRLFQLSAYIMGVLSFILTGKGVHALQESGHISITPIMPYLRWEIMGIFPSIETLLAQVLILVVVVGLWMQGKKPSAA